MTNLAAVIEQRRSLMRQAIKAGDMNKAGIQCGGVIIGLRLTTGEIDVRLKPVKEVLKSEKKRK